MPEYAVSMPKSWPWDALTFAKVGKVTHEPRALDLEEAVARHLKVKGLVVEPDPGDEEPAPEAAGQPVKGRKGGRG